MNNIWHEWQQKASYRYFLWRMPCFLRPLCAIIVEHVKIVILCALLYLYDLRIKLF